MTTRTDCRHWARVRQPKRLTALNPPQQHSSFQPRGSRQWWRLHFAVQPNQRFGRIPAHRRVPIMSDMTYLVKLMRCRPIQFPDQGTYWADHPLVHTRITASHALARFTLSEHGWSYRSLACFLLSEFAGLPFVSNPKGRANARPFVTHKQELLPPCYGSIIHRSRKSS